MKDYFVYIMANRLRTALYIGVTGNLIHRVWEHRQGVVKGFTEKYRCHDLVYFESCSDVRSAITREKQLKGWRRMKKDQLVQLENPTWRDLGDEILDRQGAIRGPSASLHSARDDSGEGGCAKATPLTEGDRGDERKGANFKTATTVAPVDQENPPAPCHPERSRGTSDCEIHDEHSRHPRVETLP